MGTQNNTAKIVVGLAVLAVLGVGLWYYYSTRPEPIKTAEDIVEAVSAPTLEVPTNPVQNKVPELNPIDRANPFKDAYKNPFE